LLATTLLGSRVTNEHGNVKLTTDVIKGINGHGGDDRHKNSNKERKKKKAGIIDKVSTIPDR
jgi:hypothetical protein